MRPFNTNPRWSNGHDFRLSSLTGTSAGDLGSTPSRGDFFFGLILLFLSYIFHWGIFASISTLLEQEFGVSRILALTLS